MKGIQNFMRGVWKGVLQRIIMYCYQGDAHMVNPVIFLRSGGIEAYISQQYNESNGMNNILLLYAMLY